MAKKRYRSEGTWMKPRIRGRSGPGVARCRGRGARRSRMKAITLSLTIVCVVITGCDPSLGPPGLLRFGSDGEVRVTVEVPLQGGVGWIQQVLNWNSDGAWKLYEEIGYDSVLGDDNIFRNPGLPYLYAANYSSLLHLAIDNEGTRLWEPPDQIDDCGIGRSRVSILIRDNREDKEKEWARCAANANPLANLSTEGFEPDDGAARVIQIALRARDFTLGDDFDRYAYTGSLPFATIERGTQPGEELNEGVLVFRTPDDGNETDEPDGWSQWGQAHTGGERRPPEIDWARKMVVVAALGRRDFTGHTVEVRRVLLVGNETQVIRTKIEMVERIPGDYCTPARRNSWPYHIVAIPKGPQEEYSLVAERIPCEA